MIPAGSQPAFERRIRRRIVAPEHRFFAVTQPAFSSVLARELVRLGFPDATEVDGGGVEFAGRLVDGYRANLESRIAARIYLRAAAFRAGATEELFRRAAAVPWELYLSPSLPVHIEAVVERSRLRHEGRAAQTLSDAIHRRLPGLTPAASLVDAAGPADPGSAQLILLRVVEDRATISIDSSGEGLHRRGYRVDPGEAPIREDLAAGLLALAGWNGDGILVDGMTGSGTLAIEAALVASGRPPGATVDGGRRFRFMDWPSFQSPAWNHLLRAAGRRSAPPGGLVVAVDRNPAALAAARANAGRAGAAVTFHEGDFFSYPPPVQDAAAKAAGARLVLNPPYGRRMGGYPATVGLFEAVGERIRDAYQGWSVLVLCPDRSSQRAMRLPTDRTLRFRHGGTEVIAVYAPPRS